MTALLACVSMLALANQPTDWRPIATPPLRREAAELYSRQTVLDPLTAPGGWTTGSGEQNAPAEIAGASAEGGMAVQYHFSGKTGLEYVEVARQIPLPEGAAMLGLSFEGGADPLPVRVRLTDASGEWHQFDFAALVPRAWSLGVADLTVPGNHWGGDGNGKLDAPVTIASLVFDRTATPCTVSGTFHIRDLATYHRTGSSEPHGYAVEVPSDRARLVYEPGERIRLRIALAEAETPPVPTATVATLVDPFGKEHGHFSWPSSEVKELSFEPPGIGAYDLRLRLDSAEDATPWADFRFAVLAEPAATDAGCPFGFSTHFGQGWDPAWMDILTRVGVRWYRDETGWGGVEREKGKLSVPQTSLVWAARGRELGLELLLILDYANPLYENAAFPVSPEATAGFARYAETIAREMGSGISTYEVWNEWCGGCGMNGLRGRPEEYPGLYLATRDALDATAPGVPVIGIGGEYGGKEDVARTVGVMMGAGAGERMDGFSIHPYHYPGLPAAGFREHLEAALAEGRRASGNAEMPVWLTEIGWPTHTGGNGSSFLHQARCLVRMHALALGTPGVERVFWYDLKDDGTNTGYNENNFGIVHHQDFSLAPKPAYAALAQLVSAVTGRALLGESELSRDGLWTTTWGSEEGTVSVCFTDAPGARVSVPVPGGSRVTDMFGQPLEGGRSLEVGQDPVLIWRNR